MRFLSIIAVFISAPSLFSNEIFLPESEGIDEKLIAEYVAPYKKFKDIGFLMQDKRLQYSISQDLINREAFDEFKTAQKKSGLEMLILLSENHWIAVNNRDLKFAEKISKEIENIMLGKYGVKKVELDDIKNTKMTELKFRCVEQIEMSLRMNSEFDPFSFTEKFENQGILYENSKDFAYMYEIAMKLTNTPVFFQMVSYDIAKMESRLDSGIKINSDFGNLILSEISEKYPDQKLKINNIINTKKTSFLEYLDFIYSTISTQKMSKYRAVDRGQTSSGHSNTCLFNSVLYADAVKGNICSTKLGSLEKAKSYVFYLDSIFKRVSMENYNKILNSSKIIQNINDLQKIHTSDAMYGFTAEIDKNRIFPGKLGECSILEFQCHTLMLNFTIFPKNMVRQNGDSLLSYYGSGYYASENFAIAPVSCDLYHAQSLSVI